MYRALSTLKPSRTAGASGAEVAEIAVCLAAGEPSPVILAYPARGARKVRKNCKAVSAGERKLSAATIAAVALLMDKARLGDAEARATAVVCAGQLDAQLAEESRAAFRFASRYKLPILFLVANRMTSGQRQQVDLSTLYTEFGIPLFTVDANDAIAAYRVATEALHNARHLRGPCVIEALTLPPQSGSTSPLDLLAAYMERHGNRPS
jgi:hypothetical protein